VDAPTSARVDDVNVSVLSVVLVIGVSADEVHAAVNSVNAKTQHVSLIA
jgi:hypothetical protein